MVAIPIPVPPVPLPWTGQGAPELDLPTDDEIIDFVGRGVKATWNDVWGWVRGTAKAHIDAAGFLFGDEIIRFVPVIEAYVGQQLKAVSSFISDVGNFAAAGIDHLADLALDAAWSIVGIASFLYDFEVAWFVSLNDIVNRLLPNLGALALEAFDYAYNIAHAVGYGIMEWVLSSVMSPVLEELLRVENAIRADVFEFVAAVAGTIVEQVNGLELDLLARLALVAGITVSVARWVENCGDPMCRSFGPGTNLGKLFQAFETAGILALLMEIGDMTEDEIVARLQEFASDMGGIVDTVNDVFVGGGGSLIDVGKALL